MNALGARIRLVKGAYREPKAVAYQQKADVDAAYCGCAKRLLTEGHLPRHRHARRGDDRRSQALRSRAAASRPDRFEFQMLYGIRRDLQAALHAGRATACGSTFRSAGNGSRTSCAASASVPPTSRSSSAACLQNATFTTEDTEQIQRGHRILSLKRFLCVLCFSAKRASVSSVVKGT